MLVQMVSAGEAGGGLDRVFLHMAEYYKDLRDARGDFLQRISWPLIQLGLAILIVSGVMSCRSSFLRRHLAQMISNTMPRGSGCEACRATLFLDFPSDLFRSDRLVAFGIWKNWFGSHKVLVPLVRNIPVIGTVFTTWRCLECR